VRTLELLLQNSGGQEAIPSHFFVAPLDEKTKAVQEAYIAGKRAPP
jgi:hypothetical protein